MLTGGWERKTRPGDIPRSRLAFDLDGFPCGTPVSPPTTRPVKSGKSAARVQATSRPLLVKVGRQASCKSAAGDVHAAGSDAAAQQENSADDPDRRGS